jgi:hypothetical protein
LYPFYNHRQIIKDLIPILNSFLVNRNQAISIKATELLNLIEKKVVCELFEGEGDRTAVLQEVFNNALKSLNGLDKEILDLLCKKEVIKESNTHDWTPDINSEVIIRKKIRKLKERNLIPDVYLKVNTNIVNNNNDTCSDKESLSKASLIPFDSKQTSLLFKGYLYNEELQDCTEKVQTGQYCDEFYQKTYSKFNNLEQRLAWKRKKVCKKLFNILKILVK